MKSFMLKPAGTGSTSKSHQSHGSGSPSLWSSANSSATSSSSGSSSSTATAIVSSSLSHAKLATSAAWSACKKTTRSTFKKGTSALHMNVTDRKSHSPVLDCNQDQPRTYCSPSSRRGRRLFPFGGNRLSSKARYRSLGEDLDIGADDEDRTIFSDRPFCDRVDVYQKGFDSTDSYYGFDDDDDDNNNNNFGKTHIRVVHTPLSTTANDNVQATSTARHMQFAADEEEEDDDEWWRA
ncbi:hypothetical protein HMPREF1624_05823 [Sporothrix schenckii ATCC 58251]|uniref:Uncharacterized protein n=1 Tax=Sporothrix schenckii (strain ATCC 58251 / de Perez 2211183) TaxID=1391915 RepID=U7PPY5_SPOS1|nr:hypothetical protein HMPREF1624_05823 [Sporothrix schenckii ATCC 58251]